jgi:hypothetical protein
MNNSKAGPVVALVGAGFAILGALMPWGTIASAFGSASIAGMEGDGKITAALAVGVGLIAGIRLLGASRGRAWAILSAIGGILVAGIALVDYTNVSERVASVGPYVHAAVGSGLYISALGGLVMLVALFVPAQRDAAPAPGDRASSRSSGPRRSA